MGVAKRRHAEVVEAEEGSAYAKRIDEIEKLATDPDVVRGSRLVSSEVGSLSLTVWRSPNALADLHAPLRNSRSSSAT